MNPQSCEHVPANGFKRAVTWLVGISLILLLILNARVSIYAQSSPPNPGSAAQEWDRTTRITQPRLQPPSVTGLPTNGKKLYARIYSWINGAWQYNDFTYTATGGTSPTSSLT